MVENFKQFGEKLSQIRDLNKISLEKVFQDTRISLNYIKLIEAGDFDKLPSGYERIFLKSYLVAIKADYELLLKEFQQIGFENKAYEAPKYVIQETKKNPEPEPETSNRPQFTLPEFNLTTQQKKMLMWVPLILIFASLIILVYSSFRTDISNAIEEMSQEKAIASIDTSTVDSSEIKKILSAPIIDSLTLILNPISNVYISLKRDTNSLKMTLRKGQVYTFKALNKFNLYSSDGSKFSVKFQEQDYGILTPPNTKISYITFEKKGITGKKYVSTPTNIPTISADSLLRN